MFRGSRTDEPNPPTTPPASWLAVVVSAALVLGILAVPLKLGRQGTPAGRRAVRPTVPAAEYSPAAVSITSLRDAKLPVTPATLTYKGADGEIVTTARIRRFLDRQRSPMAPFAAHIVAAGLKYRVDPRVVVAISGVESTYGIYCRGHNAWGWGRLRWPSWPAAIDGYTRALSTEYRSLRHGRFASASRTYCPPCGRRWGVKALSIFRSI